MLLGGAPTAALLAGFIKQNAANAGFQRGVALGITAVIVVAAVLMLLRALGRGPAPLSAEQASAHLDMNPTRTTRAVLGGALVGALIATTSAGGGVILMPLLVFGFPMAMRRVVGSAIFISLLIASFAGGVYLLAGEGSEVDVPTAAWMVLGSFAGVRSGSRLAGRFEDRKLLIAAVVMIFIAAAAMIGRLLNG